MQPITLTSTNLPSNSVHDHKTLSITDRRYDLRSELSLRSTDLFSSLIPLVTLIEMCDNFVNYTTITEQLVRGWNDYIRGGDTQLEFA